MKKIFDLILLCLQIPFIVLREMTKEIKPVIKGVIGVTGLMFVIAMPMLIVIGLGYLVIYLMDLVTYLMDMI